MSGRGQEARAAALSLLEEVLGRGRMLDGADLPGGLSPAERARATALAATALRHLGAIDAVLDRFLGKPPPARVRGILRLAAAELLAEEVPAHAAVASAVDLARSGAKTGGFTGLVNAVARRVAAEGPAIWDGLDHAALALPEALSAKLTRAWGAEAVRAIAEAHLRRPPLDLTPRGAVPEGLGAERLPTGTLRLSRPGQVSALPGYAEGAWWVQDAAAAMPVRLLGDVAGLTALDVCAAPGGKTMQLAAAGARVTALDISAARMARLAENLSRTRLSARLVTADALGWEPDAPFDLVVLDAPCSATGTMRRHPDLAHRPGVLDIAPLVALQDRLLDRAWGWVKPGGRLLFCTCSLLPQEGEIRIRGFLSRSPDARLVTPAPPEGVEPGWLEGGMLRLRPDFWAERGGMDGFFAAILRREA